MILIKLVKVVSVIDCFVAETPDGKFPWRNIVCLSFVFYLDQITKIKIYHMIVIVHPKVIEGKEMVDFQKVFSLGEEADDGVVDNYWDALDKYGENGLGEVGVITCVAAQGT